MGKRIALYHLTLISAIVVAACITLLSSQNSYPIIVGFAGIAFILLRRTQLYTKHPIALPLMALLMLATSIVLQTGVFSSPFFPLLYLCMLTIAFLVRSQVAITSTFTLMAVLILYEPSGISTPVVIHLLFLLLMTPFALLLTYEKEQLEKKSAELVEISHKEELYQKAYQNEKEKTSRVKEAIKTIQEKTSPNGAVNEEMRIILEKIDKAENTSK